MVTKKVKGIEAPKANENKCLASLKYLRHNKVEVIKCKLNMAMTINIP
ncbi:hypothetical protein HPSA50_0522 [Helicobacter pylori SouthAfrica50]|uniref:Uncharacterized protein n=1 Tax=Helicobacter pylori SouthAfrica50 TaxID=1352357 RepID=T2SCP4_HELPX|nr:hypothetical protein HPSA50_0522 [Helicobacter pylori SouthAfrica50]